MSTDNDSSEEVIFTTPKKNSNNTFNKLQCVSHEPKIKISLISKLKEKKKSFNYIEFIDGFLEKSKIYYFKYNIDEIFGELTKVMMSNYNKKRDLYEEFENDITETEQLMKSLGIFYLI